MGCPNPKQLPRLFIFMRLSRPRLLLSVFRQITPDHVLHFGSFGSCGALSWRTVRNTSWILWWRIRVSSCTCWCILICVKRCWPCSNSWFFPRRKSWVKLGSADMQGSILTCLRSTTWPRLSSAMLHSLLSHLSSNRRQNPAQQVTAPGHHCSSTMAICANRTVLHSCYQSWSIRHFAACSSSVSLWLPATFVVYAAGDFCITGRTQAPASTPCSDAWVVLYSFALIEDCKQNHTLLWARLASCHLWALVGF